LSGEGAPSKEPPAQLEPREDELAAAKTLAEERLDQLLRLKADFENYRKRVIREQTDLVERASLRIVERLLPVLDDLERALKASLEHEPGEAIARGIELVYKHLHDVLVDEGLERVEAEGAFDPNEHEAVSSVPSDVGEPTILEIVRPGYKLKGKTIRPALVHVSVPEQTEQSEE
jgi:molecular chaperone GrpE